MKRIAYLGPRGTFSEQAALNFLREQRAELVACDSLREVCRGVVSGHCSEGVLPLENLLEGSVNPALDLLLELPELKIQAEMMLPVAHHLLVQPGSTYGDIRSVLSHPQALAQCSRYLTRRFPAAKLLPVESTALAASMVAGGEKGMAALGTLAAAQHYNLKLLEQNIQDQSNNCTRFVVVGREDIPRRDVPYKTSLVVSMIDRPGALYSILKEFALRGVNLTRIESRPAKTYLGEYIFIIDLDGHLGEPAVKEALQDITALSRQIRILGCYPAWQSALCQETGKQEETLQELRADIDIIDRQIIELLGKRAKLVTRVAEVKQHAGEIRDPAREAQVLARVRQLAEHQGLSPDVLASVYRTLMDYYVEQQINQLTSQAQ